MTKSEAINTVNSFLRSQLLNGNNTGYYNINVNKAVWWFNVPVHKFFEDVHLLLVTAKGFIWIKIPKNTFPNLSKFRIRQDKNAVDLEKSSDKSYMYMKDIKSGGSYVNFNPFIEHVFE